jgi:hypothetical protein
LRLCTGRRAETETAQENYQADAEEFTYMTIYHKTMLAGALIVAKADGEPVRLLSDGTVVALNRWGMYVAQPARPDVCKALPFTPAPWQGAVDVTCEALGAWLKSVPADKTFGGLLEHVDIAAVPDDTGIYTGRMTAKSHDGRVLSEGTLRGRYRAEPYPYRERLAALHLCGSVLPLGTFVFNRKRLGTVIDAIEAACKYDGEFALIWQYPIKLEDGGAGYLWRSFNEKTGQSVLFAFSLPAVKNALQWTQWELEALGIPTAKKTLEKFAVQAFSRAREQEPAAPAVKKILRFKDDARHAPF